MSRADFDDYVAYTKLHFEEELLRAGFAVHSDGCHGAISRSTGDINIIVTLPSTFPFKPPRVVPSDLDAVPWSWHRELDGALCLVAEDDHEDLWWTDVSAFLAHVASWFESSDGGWLNDRPDLDLDRYFEPSDGDSALYLYKDLDSLTDCFVRFVPCANNVMMLAGRGTRPQKVAKRHRRDAYGYVAQLGTVVFPPRSWADISALISPATDLDRRIREHAVGTVVLRYDRGDREGIVLLEVWPTTAGGIAARRLRSGADTEAARSARAGLDSWALRDRRVAIVGIGALGSFIADMLVRAGVTDLTLVDGDTVMPGNLVRHLVGPDSVGKNKAKAVKDHLTQVHRRNIKVAARDTNLKDANQAFIDIESHNLVVNATADFAVTALLHQAAAALETNIISAAIQNDGDTFRIDVLPPLNGHAPLPASARPRATGALAYDAGCGSPISPTPPHAVIEAAAATVRHAVGLLVGRPNHPAGEVHHLVELPIEA